MVMMLTCWHDVDTQIYLCKFVHYLKLTTPVRKAAKIAYDYAQVWAYLCNLIIVEHTSVCGFVSIIMCIDYICNCLKWLQLNIPLKSFRSTTAIYYSILLFSTVSQKVIRIKHSAQRWSDKCVHFKFIKCFTLKNLHTPAHTHTHALVASDVPRHRCRMVWYFVHTLSLHPPSRAVACD